MTTIAITGASGKLGRATLQHLLKGSVPPASLVPVVRDPAKLADLSGRNIQVRQGDYTDAASLESAFRGVDKLLFISTNVLGEERMRQHTNVVNAAKRAGVKYILYTSVIKPSPTAKFGASPGHYATEGLIKESGIPYTFFQNNLYLDIIPFVFAGAAETGTLTHSGGQGRIGFIARDDIAQALAKVIGSEGAKASYAITPSRPSYGLDEVAAALGKAAGKAVAYRSVLPEEFRGELEGLAVPPAAISMALGMGDAIREGEFDASSPDLEKLLGRAPLSLDAFLSQKR
jgi:NAD(P)H dehydrogenase (quinone)